MKPVQVAVLVSGSGTNLQALLDAQRDGRLAHGVIRLVISDRPGARALARGQAQGVETVCVDKKALGAEKAQDEMLRLLRRADIGLVALAGFLTILGPRFIQAFPNRILNVHPSLLPAFGGKGMYGLRVHQAALARGVKVTGATVHLVNEQPDGGPILLQRAVRVRNDDTPETLQRRVMEQAEWRLLPQAVEQMCRRLTAERKNSHG